MFSKTQAHFAGIAIGAETVRLILTTNKSDEQIAKDTGFPVGKISDLRANMPR